MDDNWQVSDVIHEEDRVFGPCGKQRKLDIDTELSVGAPNWPNKPVGMIAMDSIGRNVNATYRLAGRSVDARQRP